MSSTRIIEYYLRIVALVLASTALAKVVSISLTAPLLDRPDDLVGFLTLRQVLLVAALLEIGVIRFLVEKRSAGDRLLAVAWLSTIFAAYRSGLRVVGHTGYCACLGSLPKLLGVGERYSDAVMFGILAFLIAGSYGGCALLWRASRVSTPRTLRLEQ
ncbi:MAG TPA: hypothetical protein P5525_03725 [Candidatus Paceibacterota bacterium]|nr:hypothetical protein [Candidatus Paceibacterota bacterium]